MKIASWNVNGLRAVAKRGFADWLASSYIDVLCVQEIKIDVDSLTFELADVPGYSSYFSHAIKKGYSGVAVYSKTKPLDVLRDVFGNDRFKQEGRTLLMEFDTFSLLNVYIPHGGRDKVNLEYKLQAYNDLLRFLDTYTGKPLVLVGDFNIAHEDIDLARSMQNRNNIMFTADERKQLDRIEAKGYVDSYRQFNPDTVGYTWWPYMANARERNIGWRIDYIFVSSALQAPIESATIMPEVPGSDHCPVSIKFGV